MDFRRTGEVLYANRWPNLMIRGGMTPSWSAPSSNILKGYTRSSRRRSWKRGVIDWMNYERIMAGVVKNARRRPPNWIVNSKNLVPLKGSRRVAGNCLLLADFSISSPWTPVGRCCAPICCINNPPCANITFESLLRGGTHSGLWGLCVQFRAVSCLTLVCSASQLFLLNPFRLCETFLKEIKSRNLI